MRALSFLALLVGLAGSLTSTGAFAGYQGAPSDEWAACDNQSFPKLTGQDRIDACKQFLSYGRSRMGNDTIYVFTFANISLGYAELGDYADALSWIETAISKLYGVSSNIKSNYDYMWWSREAIYNTKLGNYDASDADITIATSTEMGKSFMIPWAEPWHWDELKGDNAMGRGDYTAAESLYRNYEQHVKPARPGLAEKIAAAHASAHGGQAETITVDSACAMFPEMC